MACRAPTRWTAAGIAAVAVVAGIGRAAGAEPSGTAAPAQAARPRAEVIDARPAGAPAGARDAARQSLAEHTDPIPDAALRMALAGEADDSERSRADSWLADAGKAYGRLDCSAARGSAEMAARKYLTLADPESVAAPVERALSIILLCADSAGDRSAAYAAAGRLRALRVQAPADPPEGVPAAVWARYPEVDAASNVTPAPVTIEADPAGTQIWIDLLPAGTAPIDRALRPGSHWVVAAATGHIRTLTEIQVKEGKAQTLHVVLAPARPDAWSAVRQRVAGWRERAAAPAAAEVGAVLREAGLDVAILLHGDQASVWLLKPGAQVAERAETVVEAVQALAAKPIAAAPIEKKKKRPKWIYGAVIGGVLLAAGFVYLMDSGEDVQRIEVSWP